MRSLYSFMMYQSLAYEIALVVIISIFLRVGILTYIFTMFAVLSIVISAYIEITGRIGVSTYLSENHRLTVRVIIYLVSAIISLGYIILLKKIKAKYQTNLV